MEYIDADVLTRRRPRAGQGPAEPARTETERALAAMLAEVLEVPEVGRNDDFFSLGGDSILAVQLAARARDAGIPLTARMVFEHPDDSRAGRDRRRCGTATVAERRHPPRADGGVGAVGGRARGGDTSMFAASQDGEP